MKKSIFATFILIFLLSYSFADEIHLQDDTIIKGKIIQIKEKYIEYDPEGNRPFDLFPKDQVTKIVYDDGRIVRLSQKELPDKIHLHDETIIQAKILRVTAQNISYNIKKLGDTLYLARDQVLKIQFGGDKEIILSGESGPVEGAEAEEEPKMQSGGFHDSLIRIGAFGGFTGTDTDALDRKENRVSLQYTQQILQQYQYIDETIYYEYYGGVETDMKLYTIPLLQERAFDLTGLKFGIKGRYSNNKHIQDILFRGFQKEYSYKILMDYDSWGVGPQFNMIFSPRSNAFNLVIHAYFLYGYISEGELSAAPVTRDKLKNTGILFDRYEYRVSFQGNSFNYGLGYHFVLNGIFPVTIGANMVYSYTRLKLDNPVPIYQDLDKNITYHRGGIEISAGIHFL